jgi:predicted alternative tryptophan synthase beta-subunit
MALDDKTVKIVLDERDIPTHWYNVVPDLPEPPCIQAPASRSAPQTWRRCSR